MNEHHLRPLQGIKDIQAVVASHDHLAGLDEASPFEVFQRLHEEHIELEEALTNQRSREEVAGEIADNIILLNKLANVLGLDVAVIVTGKLHRNYAKFVSPMQQGLTQAEARSQWDRSQDNQFLKGV